MSEAQQDIKVVILSGVSGSGKSTALRALEDAGYYCVDNLPIIIVEKLLELTAHTAGEVSRIALGVDAREGRFLAEAPRVIRELRTQGADVEIVFLDCSDEALIRRYSETRRRRPMAGEGSVADGIAAERQALAELKALADEVIDTTTLNVHELKKLVTRRFAAAGENTRLGVTIVSFGFRFGIPTHADLVLDVRFLPNPYFVPELRPYPGTEPTVAAYVLSQPDAKAFLERLQDLLAFLLPRYRSEGKTYLTIAIGCTGGRHRSVALAAALTERLSAAGQSSRLWHRDIDKE